MKIRTLQFPVPVRQPDAYLSKANPVSTTLYTVLDTTSNVKLYSVAARITWAVTQPNPLEVVVTVDGDVQVYAAANPASGTTQAIAVGMYDEMNAANAQRLGTAFGTDFPIIIEGRSVKVEARVTWAVTQPTPLECRVKWAKW